MGTLEQGANVAVEQCMDIKEEDKVLIVADEESKRIGLALRKEALKKTNFVRFFNLDLPAYGGRPLKRMPKELWNTLDEVTASFFVAAAAEGELETLRAPYIQKVVQKARHAHMVGVNETIMKTGMNVDYHHVANFTMKLYEKLKKTREIHVKTPAGTDFVAKFRPGCRWIPETGLIHNVGEWDNLPAGEVFTAPQGIDGRAVIDGSLGDWIGQKYEDKVNLEETPLVVDMESRENWGELTSVRCDHGELLKDFKEYVNGHEFAKRVGEMGLGTNRFINEIICNILQDEKFPAVHIAFGDPYEEKTFAGWTCPYHVDLVMLNCSIWLDDHQVMEEGEYLMKEF